MDGLRVRVPVPDFSVFHVGGTNGYVLIQGVPSRCAAGPSVLIRGFWPFSPRQLTCHGAAPFRLEWHGGSDHPPVLPHSPLFLIHVDHEYHQKCHGPAPEAPYQQTYIHCHSPGLWCVRGLVHSPSDICYTNIAVVCHDAHCEMPGVSVPVNT